MTHHAWQNGKYMLYNGKLNKQNLQYCYTYDNVHAYMGKNWKEVGIPENHYFIKNFEL